MQESLEEMLTGCVNAIQARDINAARLACVRVRLYCRGIDSNRAGQICAVADRAEEALFDLLNYADSFGYCKEAGRAITEYREAGGA